MNHLADDRTDPVSMWLALATNAGQTWLAPLIVGTCCWNALHDSWLPIQPERCRYRDPADVPPLLAPLPRAEEIGALA
ncbi:MAG: hypothetical protein ACTHM8_02195 [Sphingomonas sp.]